jgi:hypothetical protein
MELEIENVTGSGYGARKGRLVQRMAIATGIGTRALARSSYGSRSCARDPTFRDSEPRPMAEKALTAVIQET